MLSLRKKRLFLFLVIGLCLSSFIPAAYAAPYARLMPKDKVVAYQDGKIIAEFKSEVPLPENTPLVAHGNCGIKTKDLYLVATDQTKFSITGNQISVQKGTIYFALSKMPKGLIFINPAAALTVQQIMVNAANSEGMIKGFISDTEFGVIEGGSILISSQDSEKLIPAGKKIEVTAQTVEGTVGAGWLAENGLIAIGGLITLGAITYLVVEGDSNPSPTN